MMTLKQFRSRYRITQKELAEKIGVSPATISKYERGEWTLNQYVIDRIKEEYGVDIRPLKKKVPRKKVWMKSKPLQYTGKYKEMAVQFRKDGADEYQVEKFIREEMERDAFEKESGTTNLQAFKTWQGWPEERREMYLHNAFCGTCGGATSFAPGYDIRIDKWGLVVEGTCAKCGGKIRRVCD